VKRIPGRKSILGLVSYGVRLFESTKHIQNKQVIMNSESGRKEHELLHDLIKKKSFTGMRLFWSQIFVLDFLQL
jgi:hypothetical protein